MPTAHFPVSFNNAVFGTAGPATTNGRLIGNAVGNHTLGNIGATGSANDIVLEIYRGTPETDFSTFTDASTRASDLLIRFGVGVSSAVDTSGGSTTARTFQIGRCLTPTSATGTGSATWFLLRRNPGSTGLTTVSAMLGTVGLTGSGADLQIPGSTAITAGTPYTSAGFLISFPVTMTV